MIVRERLNPRIFSISGLERRRGPSCPRIDGLLTVWGGPCETHEYAIRRKGGVCPGKEDAGAEYASLPAGALAYMDMGVFSGTWSADIYAVCTWVWAGQS